MRNFSEQPTSAALAGVAEGDHAPKQGLNEPVSSMIMP